MKGCLWSGPAPEPPTLLSAAFSPDSHRIATGNQTGQVAVRLLDDLERVETRSGNGDGILALRFTPDGRHLISGGADRRIKVWDTDGFRETHTLVGHGSVVRTLAVGPDSRFLISAGDDRSARIWSLAEPDLRNSHPVVDFQAPSDVAHGLSLSPDGRTLLSVSDNARVYDTSTGAHLRSMGPDRGQMHGGTHSPDGQRIATIEGDGNIRVWSESDGRELLRITFPRGPANAVTFLPDSRRLALVGDGRVAIHDGVDGREIHSVPAHPLTEWSPTVKGLDASADGRFLATGGRDRTVRIWEVEGLREVRCLSGFPGSVYTVGFSPDGQRLVAGAKTPGPEVSVWDLQTSQAIWRHAPGSRTLNHVEFTPDGRRILVVHDSSTAELLDAGTGREVFRFKGERDVLLRGTVSANGGFVALARFRPGENHLIRVWSIPTQEQCDAWLRIELDASAQP